MQGELKACSRCKSSKEISEFGPTKRNPAGRKNICRACENESARKYYKRNVKKCIDKATRWRKENPEQYRKSSLPSHRKASARTRRARPEEVKARRIVNNAIRSGKIKRLPCEVCGNVRSEAHHEDYAKPLEVVFLCKTHHVEAHKKNLVNEFINSREVR